MYLYYTSLFLGYVICFVLVIRYANIMSGIETSRI